MTAATLPLQLLLLTVSGWVHRHQQDVIAYLVEENRVLKEQLGGRKLRLGGRDFTPSPHSMGLIRFGGHLPKGEYDVDHGGHEGQAGAAELHG